MTAEEALYDSMKIMSIPSLKPKQKESIISFVDGNNVLVSLPTGYGKSIIYLLLPLVFDRVRSKLCSVTLIMYKMSL